MRSGPTTPPRPVRAAQGMLAALVGLALLVAGIVVGAGPAAAQNAVGASTSAVINTVGPPTGIGAGQRLGESLPQPQIVVATSVAAKGADEFVDLASAARRNHILYGDATGGGHLWPGLPGKTPFPEVWSPGRVMHEISDVATDPNSISRAGRGGSTIVTGTRDGVDIQVILRNGDIVTGYPTNLLRNQ